MTNELHEGKRLTFTNAGSAISAGALVAVGDRCGIAIVDIAASSGTGTLSMSGTFTLAKDGDEAFTQGQKVFKDGSANKVTGTATSGNVWVGYAEEAATEASTSCRITLAPAPKKAANVAYSAGTNLTGVDGAGSNAAPLAGTETRLDAIDTAIAAILTSLKNAGVMSDS